jgi:hypothetical protein
MTRRKLGEPYAIIQVSQNARGRPIGESNPAAKWSDATVEKARQLHREGLSLKRIGKALGVPWPTVQCWIGQSGRTHRNQRQVRIAVVRRPLDKIRVLK